MFIAIRERMQEREEGFTLIELLVVVIIIGILAAIAIPVFLNQRQRAWRTAVVSDLRNAAIDMETGFTDSDLYTVEHVDTTSPHSVTDWTDADDGSQGVEMTVVISNGNTSPANQAYCLSGTHVNMTGVVAIYDSTAGGIDTSVGVACPLAADL